LGKIAIAYPTIRLKSLKQNLECGTKLIPQHYKIDFHSWNCVSPEKSAEMQPQFCRDHF